MCGGGRSAIFFSLERQSRSSIDFHFRAVRFSASLTPIRWHIKLYNMTNRGAGSELLTGGVVDIEEGSEWIALGDQSVSDFARNAFIAVLSVNLKNLE
jgi:hypothetical protein